MHDCSCRGEVGESNNEDVLKTARPKYSRAAGLSVSLCVNNGPANVKQKHVRLFSVQTISIVVFAHRPFCTKCIFELLMGFKDAVEGCY